MKGTAVVIGSGPNGLAGAIRLAQAGLRVTVYEAQEQPGGGASTGPLTLPGFRHDLGSAIHPMALSSPFFQSLHLHRHGLRWIFPPAPLAHPMESSVADGGLTVERNLDATVRGFGADARSYQALFAPLIDRWPVLMREVLRPLIRPTRHPLMLARFGLRAFQPATLLARTLFRLPQTRTLFAGLAAHSILPLDQLLSSAFALILGGSAHALGWPIPAGGSQSIADALVSVLSQLGGKVVCQTRIHSLAQLDNPDLVLCDVTPRQFVALAGKQLNPRHRSSFERFRYGPGIFKMDWALREPIPWRYEGCRRAGTVHLGATLEEIRASELSMYGTAPSSNPFIILTQPSLFDPSRAPAGRHTAWAYAHVPNGWKGDGSGIIEDQVERFAPGFRDCILARHTAGTAQLEAWNANLIGGDLNAGIPDLKQFLFRPTWRQYATPIKGVYLCSASTPPGGGVHGMCGFNAAEWALRHL